MKEVGIDISKQKPKIITEDMIRNPLQSKYGMHGQEFLSYFIHTQSDRLEYRRSKRQTNREGKRDQRWIERRVKELVKS